MLGTTLVACGGGEGIPSQPDQPDPSEAINLMIVPQNPINGSAEASLPKGKTVQYQAILTYKDGSYDDVTENAEWTSDAPLIASVNKGLVTGIKVGQLKLVADYAGLKSNVVPIEVTDAVVSRLQITPGKARIALGTAQPYEAIAFYSDNTTQDVSTQVSWTSDNPAVATVEAQGSSVLATGNTIGTTVINAVMDGIKSNLAQLTVSNAQLVALRINPAEDMFVPKGLSQTYVAIGEFSDMSTQDLTRQVSWSSDNSSVVAVSGLGKVVAITKGTARISASYRSVVKSNEALVTVTDAILTRVQVDPVKTTIPKGTTQDYIVTGIYSDNSTLDISDQAGWMSSDVNIATIQPAAVAGTPAVAYGNNAGDVLLTAILNGVSSQPVSLSVTNAVATGLVIDPADATIPVGVTQGYSAIATFSDGSVQNVTRRFVAWQSDDTSGAPVGPDGVVYGIKNGDYQIKAKFLGVNSNLATLRVTPAQLQSLEIIPATSRIPKGLTQRYRAIGKFTDGTYDVTSLVSWIARSPDISISSRGSLVVAYAVNVTAAPVTIEATMIDPQLGNPVTGVAEVMVTDAIVRGLRIERDISDSIPAGVVQDYVVFGMLSDGSEQNISDYRGLRWASNSPDVIARNSQPTDNTVQAVGVRATASPATLTASLRTPEGVTLSDTTTLSVGDAIVSSGTSLLINPELTPGLPVGMTQAYRAFAFYTDGQSRDVTSASNWTSDDNAIANIDNNTNKGVVTAIANGVANITARYIDSNDPDREEHNGRALVRVTNAVMTKLEVMQRCEIAQLYPHFDRSGIICETNKQLTPGTKRQLFAIATYSDGEMKDVTAQVVWQSGSSYADFLPPASSAGNWTTPPGLLRHNTTAKFDAPVTISAMVDGFSASYDLVMLGDAPSEVRCSTLEIAVGSRVFICPPTIGKESSEDLPSDGTDSPGGMVVAKTTNMSSANVLCADLSPSATVTPTFSSDMSLLVNAVKGEGAAFDYGRSSIYYQFGWPGEMSTSFITQEVSMFDPDALVAIIFGNLSVVSVPFAGTTALGISCMRPAI